MSRLIAQLAVMLAAQLEVTLVAQLAALSVVRLGPQYQRTYDIQKSSYANSANLLYPLMDNWLQQVLVMSPSY